MEENTELWSSEQKEERNIDDLNEETFGDGAVEGDWESSHYIMTGDTPGRKSPQLPLHRVENREDPEKMLADIAQLKIKELWPSSSPQPNPFNSIWSSPELPTRPDYTGSPSLHPPAGSKIISVEQLEREMTQSPPDGLSTPPHPHPVSPHPQPISPSRSPAHMTSPPTHMIQPPLIGMVQGPPPGLPHPLPPPRGVHPSMLPWLPHPPPPHGFRPLLPPPNVPILRGLPPLHSFLSFNPLFPPHPHQHPPPPPPGTYPPFNQLSPPTAPPRKSKRSEYLDEMKVDGSGFMTQKEKDWVIKIQLIQLQTQDPENEDYYYQNYRKRRQHITRHQSESPTNNTSQQNGNAPSQTRPLPKFTSHVYKPKEFEGTLGKLTVSSIVAPRKVIDVPDSNMKEVGGVPADSYRRKKQSLIIIEALFFDVLTLEDLERRALSLDGEEEKDALLAEKEAIAGKIFALLKLRPMEEKSSKSDDVLLQMVMTYRKGKKVIKRILPFLNDDQAFAVVLGIVRNLPSIVKRDTNDQVLPELSLPLYTVISLMDLELVSKCVLALLDGMSLSGGPSPSPSPLIRVCMSEFGAGLLLALLKCGQDRANKSELVGEENNKPTHEKWGLLVKQLHDLMAPHQEQLLSKQSSTPLIQYLNVISK